MNIPIKLFVPSYYNERIEEGSRLKLKKTKALLPEDENKTQCIASIESVAKYQCHIPEISEKFNELATTFFHRNRERQWELPITFSGCKVYEYSWTQTDHYQFQIFWIVISEQYLLQLVGLHQPLYASYYKNKFRRNAMATQIDTAFDYTTKQNSDTLFEINTVPDDVESLQALIAYETTKEAKKRFLEEHLKVGKPNFYTVLEEELKERELATVEAFMCRDWNCYYDLYNPENFSDPDSSIAWEDNSDAYEYYELPLTDNTKVEISVLDNTPNLNSLRKLIKSKEQAEQRLLDFFEHYTFGNGGAYASGIHFEWAKIEIERLHKTTYTKQEFLKRNLCLASITLIANTDSVELDFDCSWDTEHGIKVVLNEKLECSTED